MLKKIIWFFFRLSIIYTNDKVTFYVKGTRMIILNFVTVHKKALISLCSTTLTIRNVDQEDLIIINSELLVIFMLFIVNLLFM